MSGSAAESFGAYLREAREQRGLTLQQIAASTKISTTVLRALEAGKTEDVPGGIFARAFVKAYAHEVGLDPDDAVNQFLDACGAARPKARTHSPDPERPMRTAISPSPAAVWLTVAGVSVVALLVIFSLLSGGTPEPAVSEPGAAARGEINRQALAASTGPLTVEIHPTEPCWVSLTVDGDRVFSRVLQRGEREVHEATEEVVIIVGDTSAFAFSINGQQGRLPDQPGQVATVTIDRDNFRRYVAP